MHAMQFWIVASLVPLCTVYVVWKLMPSAAQRALAASMLRAPHLPRRLESALHKALQPSSGCDGCDRAANKPAATRSRQQPIRFHPPARR